MAILRLIMVCCFAAALVGCSSRATQKRTNGPSQPVPIEKIESKLPGFPDAHKLESYLSANGHLTETLEIGDWYGGRSFGATNYIKIQPDGKWQKGGTHPDMNGELSAKDRALPETTGLLNKDELATLAKTL